MSELEPLSDIEGAALKRELAVLVGSVASGAPVALVELDDDGLCLVCREVDCGGHGS